VTRCQEAGECKLDTECDKHGTCVANNAIADEALKGNCVEGGVCTDPTGCAETWRVYEGQDLKCLHYGVECELPCEMHCPCNDCQDVEIYDTTDMTPGQRLLRAIFGES